MMRDKRDIRPVFFKLGVVLAFSLGGILYSIFRARRIKPSKPSSPKPQFFPDGGNNNQAGYWEASRGLKNVEDNTFNSCCSVSKPGEEQSPRLSRTSISNIGCSISPRSISTNDKDLYLLPEFNDLVKELDMSVIKASFSPRKDAENPIPNTGISDEKLVDHELEIRILRNTVKTLKERERLLEFQLLDYRGMKEQETAVMELQNRLKINNMEAKLFNLKIETLKADKKRLEEQVADYAKVVSELESAKTKIKLLKKKLRTEDEQNKGHILALQERVVKLQDHENHVLLNPDVQLKSHRIKELEEEDAELRKFNHILKEENSSLAQKLDYLQNLATSLLEDEQGEALKEEYRILRQKNEDMVLENERLQADRCSDIEELVYLRWINACLRYELRNYQPVSGKTIARDLSKTLSPKSEEKAKQLILEYAQKESNGEKGIIIGTPDFDSDQWSSSQSNLSGEYDDSSVDLSISTHGNTRLTRKSKVLGKLMNLLRGKHSHHHHHRHRKDSSLDASPRFDDSSSSVGRRSIDLNVKSGNSSQNSSRRSLDLPRYTYLQDSRSTSKGDNNNSNHVEGIVRNSSDGSSSSVSRVLIGTISEDCTNLPGEEQQQDHDQEDAQKSDLVKYASALRNTPSDRRLSSYCSF